jgi:hypothetical protein
MSQMNSAIKILLLMIYAITFFACGTTKGQQPTGAQPQRPMENYQANTELPPSVSTVNIPIKLSANEIERLLNNKLNGVIYEDNNMDDDGLMMKATKIQPINIRLEGFQMVYRVPLKLWVFKKIIGSRGIEAEGELALTFKTVINVNWDWSVNPQTLLVGYEWIRNMAVKTGLGNIDVKYIANIIIDRSKNTLTQSIDNQLKAQFQIRKNLEDAWQQMQQPVAMNSSYGMWWVKLTPQSLAMTPFKANGDLLESVISANSITEVIAGSTQPQFRINSYLPNFQIGSANTNDFMVNLTTDISFKEAETMAKTMMKDMKFNPGGKEIVVKDIQLFGQNDKMVINTKFEGDYKGSLYMTGRPVFNAEKNAIELVDLDYDLDTKSFLLKGGKWLFDKMILKKMKEACIFPIDENVTYFKTMMNDMLKGYKFNNNVTINGFVDDIKVDKIALIQGNIKIYVSSKGKLDMDVKGLDSF